MAFHVLRDERVRGLVLINQQTFHWSRGDSLAIVMRSAVKANTYYRKALFDPRTWARLLRREIDLGHLTRALRARLQRWVGRQGRSVHSFVTTGAWEHSEVARLFLRLVRRGASVLAILGDHDGGIDALEEHLGRGARRLLGRPGFELQVLAGVDHTFTSVQARALLGEVLLEHLERVTSPRD